MQQQVLKLKGIPWINLSNQTTILCKHFSSESVECTVCLEIIFTNSTSFLLSANIQKEPLTHSFTLSHITNSKNSTWTLLNLCQLHMGINSNVFYQVEDNYPVPGQRNVEISSCLTSCFNMH